MVVQFSTGGRGRDHEQRKRPLSLVPEMASFATGSVNFTNWIYENPPKFIDELAELLLTQNIKPEIEIFNASMLYTDHRLPEHGAIRRPLHIQFVLGLGNALPVRPSLLAFLVLALHSREPP